MEYLQHQSDYLLTGRTLLSELVTNKQSQRLHLKPQMRHRIWGMFIPHSDMKIRHKKIQQSK
jgi:hypothetical protein